LELKKYRRCRRRGGVDSGEGNICEFFAYKYVRHKNCKRRRREAAIAEGKKPLTTRGSGGASKAPPAGSGAEPQKRTRFWIFHAKWSTFSALVSLMFLNNQIEKIVP